MLGTNYGNIVFVNIHDVVYDTVLKYTVYTVDKH